MLINFLQFMKLKCSNALKLLIKVINFVKDILYAAFCLHGKKNFSYLKVS